MSTPAQKSRKIAVLGSRSVGKSSLCVQFVDNHFVESYYPTIENTFSKEIKYKNQVFQVEIVDTAGQDEFSITDSRHFIGMHGYLIVYAVTSVESFEMAKIIREKIMNQLGYDNPPMLLVGNKCDARPEDRQVATEVAQQLADSAGIPFVEASARYNQNVAKSFEDLVEEIEKAQKPAGEPSQGSKCVIM